MSIKILLVEDDRSIAALFRKKLSVQKNLVCEVAWRDQLSSALAYLEAARVDIILLDLMLPDSEELNTLDRVLTQAPETAVVVLSGLDDEGLSVEAVQRGAQDYLVKGHFDSNLLTRVIKYAIERQRMRVDLNWHTRELRSTETRLRTLIENTTDGIIIINNDDRVDFVNPAAEELFGRTSEDFRGQPFGYTITAGATTELTIGSGDDEIIAEMHVAEITWAGDIAYLASVRNITYHKQAEETLKQANKELKQLHQMKSDFVSFVSHELRTPLTSLKNAVDLVASGKTGELSEAQERLLAIATRNVTRLSKLIHEHLDLFKLESNKITLQFREIDLPKVIREVAELFQIEAENKGLKLNIACETPLPKVYTDTEHFEHILSNLVSNAIKYTPEGGSIDITTRSRGEEVELCVADTGIGLDEEQQKLIFEKFYRAESDLTPTTDGFGLGLYIVQRLVHDLGGKIWLESEPDRGSTFFVTLPVISSKQIEMAAFDKQIRQFLKDPVLSLLIVALEDAVPPFDSAARSHALAALAEQVRNALVRTTDHVVSQPTFGRMILILRATDKNAAAMVKQKLEKRLSHDRPVSGKEAAPGVRLLGPATYPEDGSTVNALIDHLNKTTEPKMDHKEDVST